MANNLPIFYQELFQLTNAGISPNDFTFSTCTCQSDKFICVRTSKVDQTGQSQQVIIVDTAAPQSPLSFPISADSAIMHPRKKIIALKAGEQLQIFHLDKKKKLNEHTNVQPVTFWKWINDDNLVLVTKNAVFHWDCMTANSKPVKMFDTIADLAESQIINYRVSSDLQWLCLVGIASKDGMIKGTMQLYSVEKQMSQPIDGHACVFSTYTVSGSTTPTTLFCFANRTLQASNIFVLEVGRKEGSTGPAFQKKVAPIPFPTSYTADAQSDFPVSMEVSEKFKVVYMITKFGYFYLFDLDSGSTIYTSRISSQTIFVTVPSRDGMLGVNRLGQVLYVAINEQVLIPYIMNTLRNNDLAIGLASRAGLPGAEAVFKQKFDQLMSVSDWKGAAKVAFDSPAGMLRTMETIQRFQLAQAPANQPSPLLQYFSVLLENGKLNKLETLELAKPVLQQGRKQLLEKWLQEDRLGCSEEFGDLLKPHDVSLALQIYFKADARPKVVMCLAELGEFEKIVAFCKKVEYTPDWNNLLMSLIRYNPQGAVTLAKNLINNPEGGRPPIDAARVVDLFTQNNLVQEATSLLLDVLKGNRPEDGPLQTRLLELNLMSVQGVQVADAILGNDMFTHYNRLRIAQLCEKAGLFQRAVQHYTDLKDIKRCLMNTHMMNQEFLINFFSNMSVDDTMDCLRDLLRNNMRQNLQVVVGVAIKYSEQLGSANIIELFESYNCAEGLCFYLSQIINTNEEPEVHYKYIEAATKTGQFAEVERIVRESKFYDPEKVKNFLKESKLVDQLPFMIVCDRFDFVGEMTRYLYNQQMMKYIEIYVQQLNPRNTPQVVGALLECDCDESYVKNLILNVGTMCPPEELISVVETSNRLKLIVPFLEARLREGNTDAVIHNALAKIYVDLNTDAESFLTKNQYYDSLVVGAYCENRDPNLAYIAYKRGGCDKELVAITSKSGLFKNQAKYVVQRKDLELWALVLQQENAEHRRCFIDQVVQTALPETADPDEVSAAVKAFMSADMPNELIELLEKIVMENGNFSGNRNLQNLLILTAIKADKSRVMDYIQRLDNYESLDIANITIESELYEEAFVIYKKFNHNELAIQVLIERLNKLDVARDFAYKCNDPKVYSKLAGAQLTAGLVREAIDSYVKAENGENYEAVINAASSANEFTALITFLEMCRKKHKNSVVESELAYSFARTSRLAELDELINGPNCIQIMQIGDRCYREEMFEAARALFSSINNNARLASCLVKLKQYQAAVDAAKKANSTRTWKEINAECVSAGEFTHAKTAGLNIIIHGDELDELVRLYESYGYFDHVISLLESGLGLERAHVGMFTQLAILYSNYKEEKLMEHLKLFHTRLNIPKVLKVAKANHQWSEATYLHVQYEEFEQAALTMIEHVEAWDNALFKDVIMKVTNSELCFKSIRHYLNKQPTLLHDLLLVLAPRIDPGRMVDTMRELGKLPFVKSYLQHVQERDMAKINETLHDLYIEEEDYEALRRSIDTYSDFDTVALANRLKDHELLEFRRIASYLYKRNKRWAACSEMAKKDHLWKDSIDIAYESASEELSEGLLKFFAELRRPDCFVATLYTCYIYIRPDVALEYAWRYGYIEYVMPFLIQTMREVIPQVNKLKEVEAKRKEKEESNPGVAFGQGGVVAPGSMMNMPMSMMGMPMPVAPMSMSQMPMAMPIAPSSMSNMNTLNNMNNRVGGGNPMMNQVPGHFSAGLPGSSSTGLF